MNLLMYTKRKCSHRPMHLMRLDTCDKLFATSAKGDYRCDFLFAKMHITLLLKKVLSIKKKLFSLGVNSFLFEETLFQKGEKCFDRVAFPESVYSHLNLFGRLHYFVNPLKTEWTRPHYLLEDSIFDFRYARQVIWIFQEKNGWTIGKQWRRGDPDQTQRFCGVWSGSALFANYPFMGLQTTMG